MNRVVITGMGVVSPIGNSVPAFWGNLCAGKHGIAPIAAFDTEGFPVKVAGEVKGFDPLLCLSKQDVRRTDLYCQYAFEAARQALDDCGTDFGDCNPYRIGSYIGSGIGGMHTLESEHDVFNTAGYRRVSPFAIPKLLSNMAAGEVAIRHGFKGESLGFASACATSSNAIGEAFEAIAHGRLDACLAGGAEASVTKYTLAGFWSMRALTTSADPDRASIPFDGERSGFVMGEGAGVVILEELGHALDRAANIYAEVVGYGATTDGSHAIRPEPTGEALAEAMLMACREAGIAPEQVGYINAHGTSTPVNDRVETAAVKRAFGKHAKKLLISSTKSMTGHMLGAAGAVEAIACALTLHDALVPMTVGYRTPDPACDLNYVTAGSVRRDVEYALSNSCGFGGHNAVLCFRRFRG